MGHFFLRYHLQLLSFFLKKIISLYFKVDLKINFTEKKLNTYQIDKPSFVAWFFLLVGFLFPSLMAVVFNEYRSTLFQLSFIFNSIGSILSVLYTERRASIYTDHAQLIDEDIIHAFEYYIRVINSRLIMTSIIIITSLIFFIVVNN